MVDDIDRLTEHTLPCLFCVVYKKIKPKQTGIQKRLYKKVYQLTKHNRPAIPPLPSSAGGTDPVPRDSPLVYLSIAI